MQYKIVFFYCSIIVVFVLMILFGNNLFAQNKQISLYSSIYLSSKPNILYKTHFDKLTSSVPKRRWGDSTNYFPANSIYIELLGNYTFYTINYERIISQKRKNALNARIGLGYGIIFIHLLALPLNITYQRYISNGIYFEVGPGINYLYETDFSYERSHIQFCLNVGFRFLVTKRFLIRLCYSPKIPTGENTIGVFTLVPFYMGLSLGGSWGNK
jgi:hypothetical protein